MRDAQERETPAIAGDPVKHVLVEAVVADYRSGHGLWVAERQPAVRRLDENDLVRVDVVDGEVPPDDVNVAVRRDGHVGALRVRGALVQLDRRSERGAVV